MILQFARVRWTIHAPQACYWRFEVRKVLLNTLGGTLSCTSNGESQSQRMGYFLKLLSGIVPTHFNFLYKANKDIISPFLWVFRFFRDITHSNSLYFLWDTKYSNSNLFSREIFETSSLRYHRLSYTLVSANLYFLKHFLFFSATLLDHLLLLFFTYRIQSFHSRFI